MFAGPDTTSALDASASCQPVMTFQATLSAVPQGPPGPQMAAAPHVTLAAFMLYLCLTCTWVGALTEGVIFCPQGV